jgi:hypothetical protein
MKVTTRPFYNLSMAELAVLLQDESDSNSLEVDDEGMYEVVRGRATTVPIRLT